MIPAVDLRGCLVLQVFRPLSSRRLLVIGVLQAQVEGVKDMIESIGCGSASTVC